MAPEMLKSQIFNHKADIFSLGVIVYELYTLKNPFSLTTLELVNKIEELVKNLPPLPDSVDPQIRNLVN